MLHKKRRRQNVENKNQKKKTTTMMMPKKKTKKKKHTHRHIYNTYDKEIETENKLKQSTISKDSKLTPNATQAMPVSGAIFVVC